MEIITSSLIGNPWIDGLIHGWQWREQDQELQLDYSFIDSSSGKKSTPFSSYAWSQEEEEIISNSLRKIEAVCPITFIRQPDNSTAEVELKFHLIDNKTYGSRGGFSYPPEAGQERSGITAFNKEFYSGKALLNTNLGGFYEFTFLHEICHALGLKHPHDKGGLNSPKFPGIEENLAPHLNSGSYHKNSPPFTQMGYVTEPEGEEYADIPRKRGYGYLSNLGTLDTATLQHLYGINKTTNNKDNIYKLPLENKRGTSWQSLWDTGGVDKIDGSASAEPVTIDLRNATLEENKTAGGRISSVNNVIGGYVIAHDWDGKDLQSKPGLCVIENASGGSNNDHLRGNHANNVLRGGPGNDGLIGGNGDDTLTGGRGKDVLKGGPGADQFVLSKDMPDEIQDLNFDEGDSIMYGENELKRRRDLKIIESTSNFEETDGFTLFRDSGELFLSETNRSEHEEVNIQTLIAVLTTNNLP